MEFEGVPFTRPFVDTFYKLRQGAIDKGDVFASYAYKILLNSLYGKLSEEIEKSTFVAGTERIDAILSMIPVNASRHPKAPKFGPTNHPSVWKLTENVPGGIYHPAAGAYVTARSRLLLHARMTQILRAGGRIYYCDTDSVITDYRLPPEEDKLGSFKLEYELEACEIWAPKVYRYKPIGQDWKYRCKGVPLDKGIDGKLPAEVVQERWTDYITGMEVGSMVEALVWNERGVTMRPDRISGFVGDTNSRRGGLVPKVVIVARALRHKDTKRIHANGDSRPIHIERH